MLPKLDVLFYYGIFFFFGALYWDLDDQDETFGRYWYVSLPIAIVALFPIGQGLLNSSSWISTIVGSHASLVSVFVQSLYAWLMVSGSIGLFRTFFYKRSPRMRYVSDSSYWLYLIHLPLLLILQWSIVDLNISALVKFPLTCAILTAFMLLTYEYSVRYTPIGTLLNGKKVRQAKTINL